MNDIYEVAAGTIPGRRHVGAGNLLVGRNNQDAYGLASKGNISTYIVFDGCSSGKHSEVGAKLAAEILPPLVAERAEPWLEDEDYLGTSEFWAGIKDELIRRLDAVLAIVCSRQTEREQMVIDHFLFTIVGLLMAPNRCFFFSIGDGVFAVNERFHTLGPFANNAPPYIGYELLPANPLPPQNFLIHECFSPCVTSAVIATDGLLDLLQNSKQQLAQVISGDALFEQNATESLTPWLRRLNSEVVSLRETEGALHLSRKYGLLNDDTTLVVVRRRDEHVHH